MLTYLGILLNARLAALDERGASAVEYALMVAGIAAGIIFIVGALGKTLGAVFSATNASLSAP